MPRKILLPLLAAACCTALTVSEASAWNARAGWLRADVGLHEEGDGVYLGVGRDIPWSHPFLDADFVVEYAQKKGAQPTAFSDPVGGFTDADAEVTLHVVEPGVFLGVRAPGLPVVPRLYAGTSISLKLKESWSDFPGVPDRAWGYKETDWIAHVGLDVDLGPARLDVRYSKSMVGQLIEDPREIPLLAADKAEDPFAGVREPEVGFKTETLRVGVAVGF